MSARVCSPPMMDLTRDMMTLTSSQPISSSSYPGASNQASSLMLSGLSSSSSADSVNKLCRSVSRNLFGSPGPESSQYARQKLKEIREADSKRWNFDFDNERPLDGRYQWEPVETLRENEGASSSSSASEIPKVYACSGMSFSSSASFSSSFTSAVPWADALTSDSSCVVRPVDKSNLCGSTVGLSQAVPDVSVSEMSTDSISPSRMERVPSDVLPKEHQFPILVESAVESSQEDAVFPSLLRTDSNPIRIPRVRSKQTKMTEYMPVKKRRGGPERTTAGKKKASF